MVKIPNLKFQKFYYYLTSFFKWVLDHLCVSIKVNREHFVDVILGDNGNVHSIPRIIQATCDRHTTSRGLSLQMAKIIAPSNRIFVHFVVYQFYVIFYPVFKYHTNGWRFFGTSRCRNLKFHIFSYYKKGIVNIYMEI